MIRLIDPRWFCVFVLFVAGFSFIQVSATPPAGYFLKWSDEFTNNSLNTANWEYARNGWRNSAYDTPAAVSVTNGCLVITTYTQGGTNFTGFIDTQNKVMNSYGYYEASIEFSNAPGQWSAFWLQSPWMMNVQPDGTLGNTNNNPTNGVEIDVFEHRCVDNYGNNWVDGGDNALHWNGYGAQEQSAEWSSQSIGVGSGFHAYGLLWTTNSYTFYVDGIVTWTTSQYVISSASQFIRLTSEIESNSWAGTVPPGSYPNQANSQIKMYVDYVRYYAQATSPVIVQDLPAQAPVAAGKSYQYSVVADGAPPLKYRWYKNGSVTAIAGATNTSYTVPPGPMGSNATYFADVLNSYGGVDSSTSVWKVIVPPADFYGVTIASNNPVGYWPLQETNAPAAASVETNYGSLGSAGNAYYAVTNASEVNVLFEQRGALAGNSDPAAGFYGPSGANYAFAPHRAAALTLQPPLSLECWLNSTSAVFGDLISQGGQDENGSANWGGIRLSYGGSTSGANLQVYTYTGSGSTADSLGTAAGSVPTNQWGHCVLTYDGTTAILYINGVAQSAGVLSEALNDSVPLTIGDGRWSGEGTSRPYYGLIDEVAIYTNVLTPTQVTNHWLAGTTTGSNYRQTVLNDQPLLYYRMDCPGYTYPAENIDPVAVNYGSTPVNGTYVPGTIPGSAAGPTMPALGTNAVAVPINGVMAFVDGGYSPAFNATGKMPITAMIWFKTFPSDGRMQTLMSHGGISSWALNLAGTNGTVIWNSGAGSTASTSILNDGNWHFAAGIYDGTNNYLYIDGALNNSATASGSVAGNTNDDVFLGGDPDYVLLGSNQRYFAGMIAEAAFFTNALSAMLVQTIYQAATLPPPQETMGWTNATGGVMQFNWNYGTLQSATNVAGPYVDVTNYGPFTIPATNAAQFYRVREN